MEQDFKKWPEEQTACWYLLSDEQYEWYLNQWLNEIEYKRKERKYDEMV